MNITFESTPILFGKFHLCAFIMCVFINALVYYLLKDKEEKLLLKIIHYISLCMLVLEVFKQFFCYYYVFDRQINLWFFPWQLCSMAMYCGFLIKYVNKDKQNSLLIFLATYSLVAAVVALIGPLDMLRPQILLTLQSFVYHILMITLSIISIIIIRKRDNLKFHKTFILFLLMALIAEIINVVAHQILHDIHKEPDMFYITPYYPTTQPVFNYIAVKFGILTEVIIYLGLISLSSYLIFRLIKKKI